MAPEIIGSFEEQLSHLFFVRANFFYNFWSVLEWHQRSSRHMKIKKPEVHFIMKKN